MENNKEIIFLIKLMSGGGAERVTTLLCNHFRQQGRAVTLILTHQQLKDAKLEGLDSNISVLSLEDQIENLKLQRNIYKGYTSLRHRIMGQREEEEDWYLIRKYKYRNYEKVAWLKKWFDEHNQAVVITFLYDSIFLTLLSANRKQRVIISERGDPLQSVKSKTVFAFFRQLFKKADEIVFQSPDVKTWYKDNFGLEGVLIFNPVKKDLPNPYCGKRNNRIVDFCRITRQKNILLLIAAFELTHVAHPEFELWIYGDEDNEDLEYVNMVQEKVRSSQAAGSIHMLPARSDIHEVIREYAMYVSSSDFEGMSNSMLEAMAIGLPVICTDCPAGGAKAVITDHVNGILVPVNDALSLSRAMNEIIENDAFANLLSCNAAKIKDAQSEEIILQKWDGIL